MATLRALGIPSVGGIQRLNAADILTVSNLASNAGTALILNSTASPVTLQVAGTTKLDVSATAVTVRNGAIFTGDGSGLTSLNGANISAATIPNAALANSSLTVTAGTGLSGGGAVSLGGSTSLSIASTAVSAGSYPTTGRIPTFTVGADGRLTAAGSTTDGSALTSLNGANITTSSVATSKITGGTANRVLYDNGTNASWTTAPSGATSFLRGSSPPAFDLVNLNTDTAGVVPTAKGGTNLSSFTAGGVFFASDSSSISFVGPGTAGYVLTSNGTSPTMAAPVTGTTVSVTLTSTTWTSTTFVDSGQKITLPSGGLWRITTKLRNYCQVTSGAPGANSFQLYDVTAGAVVTDSQTFGAGDYIGGGSGFGTTTTWSVLVDVASGRDIRIDVKRLAGPTYSSTGWASDTTEGTSTIAAVKLRS